MPGYHAADIGTATAYIVNIAEMQSVFEHGMSLRKAMQCLKNRNRSLLTVTASSPAASSVRCHGSKYCCWRGDRPTSSPISIGTPWSLTLTVFFHLPRVELLIPRGPSFRRHSSQTIVIVEACHCCFTIGQNDCVSRYKKLSQLQRKTVVGCG